VREFNLGQFATFFAEVAGEARLHEAKNLALEVACQMIEAEAKRVIGSYTFDWPQLADATQADRERRGYAPNEPLLRTGEMRDSITHEITKYGEEAIVGSTSEIALWQELGTNKIPPRPFLLPSAIYLKKPIEKMIGEIVGTTIAGNSIEHEILKIAIESAEHATETAKDVTQYNKASDEMDRR
jgi:phage gpG-like protein